MFTGASGSAGLPPAEAEAAEVAAAAEVAEHAAREAGGLLLRLRGTRAAQGRPKGATNSSRTPTCGRTS